MKILLAWLIFCSSAFAQVGQIPAWPPTQVVSGGGGTPFAIETGQPNGVTNNSSSASMVMPSVTTTFANDVIIDVCITNGTVFSGVTSTGGITFAREPGLTPPSSGGTTLDIFYAIAPSPGTYIITQGNTAAFTTCVAFAVTGAHSAAPFDTNAAIPALNSGTTAATITTTASNVLAFGFVVSGIANAATGFTNLNATALGNVLAINYMFATTGTTPAAPLSAAPFYTAATSVSVATAIIKGP